MVMTVLLMCHVTEVDSSTPWESCHRDFSKTCVHLTNVHQKYNTHLLSLRFATPHTGKHRHRHGGTPAEEVQVHLLYRPDKKHNLRHRQQTGPRMGDRTVQ